MKIERYFNFDSEGLMINVTKENSESIIHIFDSLLRARQTIKLNSGGSTAIIKIGKDVINRSRPQLINVEISEDTALGIIELISITRAGDKVKAGHYDFQLNITNSEGDVYYLTLRFSKDLYEFDKTTNREILEYENSLRKR